MARIDRRRRLFRARSPFQMRQAANCSQPGTLPRPRHLRQLCAQVGAVSPFASTGTYYFRSSVQLVELIQQAMSRQETVNGEYYIGPLYNIMAAQGQPIKGVEVERFISFGTPEDLQASEASAANAD